MLRNFFKIDKFRSKASEEDILAKRVCQLQAENGKLKDKVRELKDEIKELKDEIEDLNDDIGFWEDLAPYRIKNFR